MDSWTGYQYGQGRFVGITAIGQVEIVRIIRQVLNGGNIRNVRFVEIGEHNMLQLVMMVPV